MALATLPCATVLRLLLSYEPETGRLFWRERPERFFPTPNHAASWNRRYAGREALTATLKGRAEAQSYRVGTLLGRTGVKAHHVAFVITHGRLPYGQIDHINRDKTDNRASNLRDVTPQQNQWNISAKRPRKGSKKPSAYIGVSWAAKSRKWQAHIKLQNGAAKRIGAFESEVDAARAYDAIAASERGGFARLNFPASATEVEPRPDATESAPREPLQ